MSDVSSGARAPDGGYSDQPVTPAADPGYPAQTYPAETYPTETYPTETYPAQAYPTETYSAESYPAGTGSSGADDSKAKQVAGQAKDAAGQAASDVKDTAKDQVQRVGSEARTQARNVAADVRDRVSQQARSQNDKLVTGIRQAADQLEEMRGDRQDSPAATVVSRVADGGRQFADYLDRHGPEGVLREVQDFARRRPGAFLATALAAGFVVGRLGKGIAKADSNAGKPSSDSFVSGTGYSTGDRYGTAGYGDTALTGTDAGYQTGTGSGYPTGATSSTEYAATGTGTPVVVEEEYIVDTREDRR
ncbi:MAG TPA: hypothetical protein VH502_10475 [Actinoplanes sp.]|jgi:uncharacterized protein YjbJ (UPF0337 family)